MSGLRRNQESPFGGSRCGVALSWDRGSKVFDLDLQAIAFNNAGKPMDAVYYNNLKALGKGLTHSGDEVTGAKQGFDEVVWVNLAKIPKEVHLIVFVVASYKGGRIRDAMGCKFHVLQDTISNHVGSYALDGIVGQAAVIGCIFRSRSAAWSLLLLEESAPQGQHFIDILEPTVGGVVRRIIPTAPLRIKACFAMDKGSVVDLPMSSAMRQTFAGLSWDTTSGEVDLDVSAIQLNAKGQDVDTVFFGNLEGQGIVHSGDNLTGEGSGDDEVISLTLDKLAPEVQQIYFVINIYTKDRTFAEVANPKCRIFTKEGGAVSELCHYRLAEATNGQALIMGRLFRAPGDVRWGFQAIGQPCTGRTWKDSMAAVAQHSLQPPKGHALSRSGSVASSLGESPPPACIRDATLDAAPQGHCDSNDIHCSHAEAYRTPMCGECSMQ